LPEPVKIVVENFFGPLCINSGFFWNCGLREDYTTTNTDDVTIK